MGKKGKKKKGKPTGTIDVQKFKERREFVLLEECVKIQENLPMVATEVLDEHSFKTVARYLNMLGLLGRFLEAGAKKDYRFQHHHKYLAPMPQFFPYGYDCDMIRHARLILEKPCEIYNNSRHSYPGELIGAAEVFLSVIDESMSKIPSRIEPCLKNDFAIGLKKFSTELKNDINTFDEKWVNFETELVKARHVIFEQVFEPIHSLVTLESKLTRAEESCENEAKQRFENEFVGLIQEFTNKVLPRTQEDPFPENVIPLAEACIFYASKCSEEWLELCKYLIKAYMDLRTYVSKIPEDRLRPQYKENPRFMELLANFHQSVKDSTEAIEGVAKMPKLLHAKNADWMTKRKLEPDLRAIEVISHMERTSMGGR